MRGGVDARHAARNAKIAAVDYAQLTPREQMIKRFVPFYTFPRHYTPVAAKHFAENPNLAAQLSQFVKASGDTGITTEENGAIVLNVGNVLRDMLGVDTEANWGINISRLNPNLEVLKYIEAYGEVALNVGDEATELLSNIPGSPIEGGLAAARAEKLSGQTQTPFSIGGLIPTAIEALGKRDGEPIKELSDSIWLSRILLSPEDPLGEKTRSTQFMDGVLFGTKSARPKHDRKVLEYRYGQVISNLRKKIAATTDPEYRRELVREVQSIQSIARDRISKIRK